MGKDHSIFSGDATDSNHSGPEQLYQCLDTSSSPPKKNRSSGYETPHTHTIVRMNLCSPPMTIMTDGIVIAHNPTHPISLYHQKPGNLGDCRWLLCCSMPQLSYDLNVEPSWDMMATDGTMHVPQYNVYVCKIISIYNILSYLYHVSYII